MANPASDETRDETAVLKAVTTKPTGEKGGRPCSICTHPLARDIDRALVSPGGSYATVAGAFPGTTAKSLERHYKAHLLPRLERASGLAADHIGPSLGILSQLEELRGRAMDLLERAEKSGKLKEAIGAIREARGVLESQARLTGLDGSRSQTTINVINAPGWTVVQGSILTALESFPDARAAVVRALGHVIDG
nr:hypothetical protein [Acetobacter sacchari]